MKQHTYRIVEADVAWIRNVGFALNLLWQPRLFDLPNERNTKAETNDSEKPA